MSLIKMFFVFMKIGALLIGGGYVILPLLTSEFSEKRNLISSDELLDYFALSQSLPGIIAANMSIFIGYKLKGKFGAVAAFCGVIFVPFWAIVFLASCLESLTNVTFIQQALKGVGAGVIALIGLTAREAWQKSNKDGFFYCIFLFALLALLWIKLSPIEVIILFLLIGIMYKKMTRVSP